MPGTSTIPAPPDTAGFHALDRRRTWLTYMVALLLTATCLTLVLVTGWQSADGLRWQARWPSLVGLFGLMVIFVLYTQYKHRELAALEMQLRDAAVREASMQARFTELSFLFDTSTQLQLRLDLSSMLELATQRLASCLDATQCSIMLPNEETGLLEVRAAGGVDAQLVAGARVKPGEGIAGLVFASGEALVLTPEVMAKRFPEHVKRGRTIASALCVPLRFRGTPIGVVSVARASGDPFGEIHARMLETFAEHCAATVVKTEHHQDVLEQMKRTA
jgi:transcriptional regulator with GAF, ATPase, and Fis domain